MKQVRSLRAPPDVVRDVLEGVLRLMGIADTSWHSMKSFLSKRGVKEDIRYLHLNYRCRLTNRILWLLIKP